jgi:serine/threonine-protein kinase
MESARWTRIQELFHAAADLPESDQRSVLKAACGGDEALIADVMALLEEDARAAPGLGLDVAQMAHDVLAAAIPGGDQLGAYRVLSVLGEGGMGVVYLAERKDVGRLVAVKVLRDAWLSPARRERFASEQESLAQLDHPAIARLYDSGALDDGTPFFVMEYVDGKPLTGYCHEISAPVDERLRLFRSLCEAVQSAHAHAIIHRDIKPSNVLVKRDGTVRLLDFGVAKHLEDTEMQATRTMTGLRFMTPAYAAPEQFRGERTGIHTDVYSLGVVLYELLSANLPFDLSRCTPGEAEKLIVEQDPIPPSARGSGGLSLTRSAWADLDVIVLTAMHKDQRRRYRSVEALLRDIDHYRQHEPLEARPDDLQYRLGKFARRNRRPVALATAMLAAAIGMGAFFTVRLAREHDAAVAEAARAEHVQRFMLDLLEGGEKASGPSAGLRVVELLDRGAKEAGRLRTEPLTQAALYETLGAMYQRLGKYDRADDLLGRAVEQYRVLRGPQDPTVGESQVALGLLRVDQAKVADAERLVRDGLALLRRRLPPDHPAIARAVVALGKVLHERGRFDEAAQVLGEAVALRSRPGVSPLDLAAALGDLADAHHDAGRDDIADPLDERAIAIYRSELGENHPLVADRLSWLAESSLPRRQEKREEYNRRAFEIIQAWYGDDHPRTAVALSDYARALIAKKRLDEAEPLLRKAIATLERFYGPSSPQVADVIFALSSLLYFRGRYPEGAKLSARAGDIYLAAYGEQHRSYGMALVGEATNLLRIPEWPRAEALLRRALVLFAPSLAPDTIDVANTQWKLAYALIGQKRFADAEPHALAAYKTLKKLGVPLIGEFWPLGSILSFLSDTYDALGQPEKAEQYRAELRSLTGNVARPP